MRSVLAMGLLLVSAGCFSSTPSASSGASGGNCVMTISAAAGANNAFQGLSGGAVSGDYTRSRTTFVCGTLSQALEISLTGPPPNVGVTYPISAGATDAGPGGSATVKYGESMMSGNASTHVTWRGTGGTLKIDAAAKDTLSFSFSGVPTEVDPDSSQNLATGTFILAASGTVNDLLGYVP
ncbi:MAG: hypothetical protein ABIP89_01825 [Polyangiaceae bacterium]